MHSFDRELLIDKINARIERLKIILKTGDVIERQSKKELQFDKSAQLDSLSQQPVDTSLYKLVKQELSQLKANLKWLEGEDAGMCEECGCEIPIKRLLAVPTTRNCVKCTAKKE